MKLKDITMEELSKLCVDRYACSGCEAKDDIYLCRLFRIARQFSNDLDIEINGVKNERDKL